MKMVLTAGLGFGDEGKGSLTDFLTRRYNSKLTVRYNGGAQAAHTVVLKDGRHHTFSQFGSGTFAGAETFLSKFMLVNPLTFFSEAKALEEKLGVSDTISLVTVHEDALVTTAYHVAANRIRELARSNRHGSCGMGIGLTTEYALKFGADALRVRDLRDARVMERKLGLIRDRLVASAERVVDLKRPEMDREWDVLTDSQMTLSQILPSFTFFGSHVKAVDDAYFMAKAEGKGTIVFEGAQGVLLDQDFGFQPYTTWTDITFSNALEMLRGLDADIVRMGAIRSYMTRHGAGPFVTEDTELAHPEAHNGNGDWQQAFRQGHFDLVMLRYAIDVLGGVDEIAMTHLDRPPTQVCTGYVMGAGKTAYTNVIVKRPPKEEEQAEIAMFLLRARPSYEAVPDVDSFLRVVEQGVQTPITLCSFGPTAEDKRTRALAR